jgi:hypothetical protein
MPEAEALNGSGKGTRLQGMAFIYHHGLFGPNGALHLDSNHAEVSAKEGLQKPAAMIVL